VGERTSLDLGIDTPNAPNAAQSEGEGEGSLTTESHGEILEWAAQDFQEGVLNETPFADSAATSEEVHVTTVDLALDELLQEEPLSSF
jgi:hypothetical protein